MNRPEESSLLLDAICLIVLCLVVSVAGAGAAYGLSRWMEKGDASHYRQRQALKQSVYDDRLLSEEFQSYAEGPGTGLVHSIEDTE